MRSRRISSWAEISDEDEYTYEEPSKESGIVSELKEKLQKFRPPYRLFISNLPYAIQELSELYYHLNLSAEDNLRASFLGDCYSGRALLKVYDLALANRIVGMHGTFVLNRMLNISLSSHTRRNTHDHTYTSEHKQIRNSNKSSQNTHPSVYNHRKIIIPQRKKSCGDPEVSQCFNKKSQGRFKESYHQQQMNFQENQNEMQPKIRIPFKKF